MGAVPVLNLGTMGTIFGKFLTLFAASLVLGGVAGLFAAIMLKRFNVSSMPQARPLCTQPSVHRKICCCCCPEVSMCALQHTIRQPRR